MKTIKVLFAALVIALTSNFSTAQLTVTEKAKYETISQVPSVMKVEIATTSVDTFYVVEYIDQRYPNLKPMDRLVFSDKKDLTDFLNGIITVTDDVKLSSNKFVIWKSGMVRYFRNTKTDSYGWMTPAFAKKTLDRL